MPAREYSKLSFLCSKCSIFSTHTLLQLVFFETQQLQAGSHLTNKWNHLCRCRDFDLAFCLLGSVLYYYEYWIYRTLSYRGGRITTAFLSPRASLVRFVNYEQIKTCIKRTQRRESLLAFHLSSLYPSLTYFLQCERLSVTHSNQSFVFLQTQIMLSDNRDLIPLLIWTHTVSIQPSSQGGKRKRKTKREVEEKCHMTGWRGLRQLFQKPFPSLIRVEYLLVVVLTGKEGMLLCKSKQEKGVDRFS